MIKRIILKNLKGITETFDLGMGINWVFGRNGAGKTALMDAASLALTGEHPTLGKANKALFSLASDLQMVAGVNTEEGQFHLSLRKGKTIAKDWKTPIETGKWDDKHLLGLADADVWKLTPAPLTERMLGLTDFAKTKPRDHFDKVLKAAGGSEWIEEQSQAPFTSMDDLVKHMKQLKSLCASSIKIMESELDGICDEPTDAKSDWMVYMLEDLEDRLTAKKNRVLEVERTIDALKGQATIFAEMEGATFDDYSNKLWEALKGAQAHEKTTADSIRDAEQLIFEMREEIKANEFKITKENALINEWNRQLSALQDGDGKCPLCGHHGSFDDVLDELSSKIKKAEKYVTELNEEVVKWDGKMKKLQDARAKLVDSLPNWAAISDDWRAEQDKQLAAKLKGVKLVVDEMKTHQNVVNEQMHMDDQLELLQDDVRAITEAIGVKKHTKANNAKRAQLEKSLEIYRGDAEKVDAVLEGLAQSKKALVESLFINLISDANELLKGTGVSLRWNPETGIESDKSIPLKALSGAEYALASAALVFATGCQLIVVDEVDRMDEVKKKKLVENALRADPNATLRQWVFIGVQEPPKNISHLITEIPID